MKHRQIEQTRKDGRRNCAGPAGPREAGLAGGDGRDSEGQSQQGPHHTVRRGRHAIVPFKDQALCPLSSEPHTLQPDETGHTGWPRSTVCGFGSCAGSTFIHHRGVDGEEVSPPQCSQISTRHAHGSFFRLFERVLRVLVPKQGRDPCPLTVGEGRVGSGLTATAEGKNCPRPQAPAVWGQGPPGSLGTVNREQREMRCRDQERADPWARWQEETVPSEQMASDRWEAILKTPGPQGRRLGSGLGHAFPACHQVMPRTGVQEIGRCSGAGRAPLRLTLTAQAALTTQASTGCWEGDGVPSALLCFWATLADSHVVIRKGGNHSLVGPGKDQRLQQIRRPCRDRCRQGTGTIIQRLVPPGPHGAAAWGPPPQEHTRELGDAQDSSPHFSRMGLPPTMSHASPGHSSFRGPPSVLVAQASRRERLGFDTRDVDPRWGQQVCPDTECQPHQGAAATDTAGGTVDRRPSGRESQSTSMKLGAQRTTRTEAGDHVPPQAQQPLQDTQ